MFVMGELEGLILKPNSEELEESFKNVGDVAFSAETINKRLRETNIYESHKQIDDFAIPSATMCADMKKRARLLNDVIQTHCIDNYLNSTVKQKILATKKKFKELNNSEVAV